MCDPIGWFAMSVSGGVTFLNQWNPHERNTLTLKDNLRLQPMRLRSWLCVYRKTSLTGCSSSSTRSSNNPFILPLPPQRLAALWTDDLACSRHFGASRASQPDSKTLPALSADYSGLMGEQWRCCMESQKTAAPGDNATFLQEGWTCMPQRSQ